MVKSPEFITKKYRTEVETLLPDGFEWVTVDMKNPDELDKVFELLK